MNATMLAAAAVSVIATYLLLHPARRAGLSATGSWALAVGLGLGLASCVFFLALILFDGRRGGVIALDGVFLLAGLAVRWCSPVAATSRRAAPWAAFESILLIAVVAAAIAAGLSFLANTLDSPHGRWDAWSTWNVRARWLATAGSAWRDAVVPPAIHGDYPWLVPATVARLWSYGGGTPTAVPAAIGFAYAAALPLLLYAGLSALRGRVPALVAALCLLGTPLFLRIAPWQYADLPLAFNLLAALTLLALYDRDPERGRPLLLWAGIAAGLAAWTKNEGTMLVTGIILVRAGLMLRRRQWDGRGAAWFATGLLLPGAAVLYFKLTLATPMSLYREPLAVMLGRLFDPERYATILRLALPEQARGTLPVLVGLVLYAALLGRSRDQRARGMAAPVAALLAFAAGVYFFTYLTARSALTWLVPYSVDRLTLHLWPSALLALMLYVATPSERAPVEAAPASSARRDRPKRAPQRRR